MIKFTRFAAKKNRLVSILLIISGFFYSSYSQIIPDYKDRDFAVSTDSLVALMGKSIEVEATEGSINPDEYIVGPGDKIFVSINGIEEIPLNLIINQEGIMYIPKVGGIDLIMSSAGLNKTSNFRNIRIIHRDSTEQQYDLLSYLRLGKRSDNPMLREGDVVMVDKVDKVISIYGMIKYPGTYEFVEGENAGHLITIAGGLLAKKRELRRCIAALRRPGISCERFASK